MDTNGILVVNKPKGMTSHDVVQRLRRTYGMKKVGHTGTLDPMVDGVLVICFGRATKLAQYLTDETKQYHATVCLGQATTTEDVTGDMLETLEISEKRMHEIAAEMDQVMQGFIGDYEQLPPMYSAVKINGRKLYEYARNDEVIERKTRKVTIYDISYQADSFLYDKKTKQIHCSYNVKSSKGLYVRTLCVDIGKKLGVPATMADLTRTASGAYTLDTAIPLAQIMEEKPEIIPISAIKLPMPTKHVESEVANKLRLGYRLPHYFIDEKMVSLFVVKEKGTEDIIGIYEQSEKYPDKYASVKIL